MRNVVLFAWLNVTFIDATFFSEAKLQIIFHATKFYKFVLNYFCGFEFETAHIGLRKYITTHSQTNTPLTEHCRQGGRN